MKKLTGIAIATVLGLTSAAVFAQTPMSTTTMTTTKAPQAAAKATATAKKEPSAAQLAQREKMKTCNVQAKDKKGADRQAFMKTCLSK
ncbi:PsiF family protein [Hydromonas duriensis]|uniref:PsiF repeat-containing protein n=1 Tax=Hydromonas duriensis TaxID=1527608 RepID=A0A4R6Y846_9BURK|nr:PsiF family protein [Hydromonas duriensis]TDR31548.1 psiF repeat-containing protein [Hydromonas duriensis]